MGTQAFCLWTLGLALWFLARSAVVRHANSGQPVGCCVLGQICRLTSFYFGVWVAGIQQYRKAIKGMCIVQLLLVLHYLKVFEFQRLLKAILPIKGFFIM